MVKIESIQQQIIRQKLLLIKKLIYSNKFKIAEREKNRNFMFKYSLLRKDIKNIILNLQTTDYYHGPELDRAGYSGEIWIFTPIFQDNKIYLKIRIQNDKLIICISIHEYGNY